MDLFCHVSEFGQQATRLLPSFIIFGDRINLWSPSSYEIDQTCYSAIKDGAPFALSSADVLQLVEAGIVRVIGREKWLTSKTERNKHRWQPQAQWNDQFDHALLRILIEDQNLAINKRRVVIAPDETGREWARQQLDEKSEAVFFVTELLNSRQILQGFTFA